MKKRAIIGIVLAVFIIASGASGIWIWRSVLAGSNQANTASALPYSVQRSEEDPLSSHRVLSTVASQQGTPLMPGGLTLDPMHGFVWVAEPSCEPKPTCAGNIQGALGQYALSDGTFLANFTEPQGYSSPLFVAVDADGNVWFTQPSTDALGEFNPLTQSWNSWPVKKGSAPFYLTFDKQGNIWFTEYNSSNIGFFNPHTHKLVETPTPTANSNPYAITVDPQGTFWFSENAPAISQIGSFTPTQSGTIKITEYPVNTLRPHMIITDRAGNIWFSGGFQGTIGEFNPRSGNSKSFLVYAGFCYFSACKGAHISGINVDSKDNVWFTDSIGSRFGYLIPSTGQVVAQTSKLNTHPYDGLAIDSSDRVWFTQEYTLSLAMWPAGTLK